MMTYQNYIISYPKAGRTWLRALLGHYWCSKHRLSDKNLLETPKITKQIGLPITCFSHDNSSWMDKNNFNDNKEFYRDKQVLILQRNIKDIMVSAFFQASKRENVYTGTISDFIRSDEFGVENVLNFYSTWQKNLNTPRKINFVSYEDLHEQTHKIFESILIFLGETDLDEEILNKSIEFCKFENLKRAEEENLFKSFRLQSTNNSDPEAFKVRKGKIDGYHDYLSSSDIKYLDYKIKEFNYAPIKFK